MLDKYKATAPNIAYLSFALFFCNFLLNSKLKTGAQILKGKHFVKVKKK